MDPEYVLIKGLAMTMQVTEATKTCSAIIKVLLKHDIVVDMISALIFNEVEAQCTDSFFPSCQAYRILPCLALVCVASAGTLFRNNSITTHMMTCYTKAVGLPYLKNTVAPEILHVFEQLEGGGISYEVRPAYFLVC